MKRKIKSKRVKRGKRRTKRVMKGGSIFPYILQDAFWNAADSVRDTYDNLAGNYNGVSSSITVQGQV
jgi:hypothetical protein